MGRKGRVRSDDDDGERGEGGFLREAKGGGAARKPPIK